FSSSWMSWTTCPTTAGCPARSARRCRLRRRSCRMLATVIIRVAYMHKHKSVQSFDRIGLGIVLGINFSRASAVAASGKIAFRTRSEEEILDDGYKWRKYGKKSVKNSPNPRNYYRCSTEGCYVKKRVERDKDDANYVVTMYEGVHNHASPGTVYYAAQDPASGRFFVTGTHHLAP
uniref:WRKY domain-containing protein n=1 Tax=Aegilops tauschii subsp. strangulata TaxID=200361 RepID=A0A453F866_AEGTS